MSTGKRVTQIGSGAFFTIVIAAVMAYSFSGTVKGWVHVLMWGGDDTLTCGGNMVMKLEGKEVDLDGTAILAGGSCELTLKDCKFKGTTPLTIGGDAKVTIEGGSFTGSKKGISVGGAAKVTIKGATLEGDAAGLSMGGNGKVTLVGTTVKSKKDALYAGGNGYVEVQKGKLLSPKNAVRAGGNVKVVLKGAEVKGEISKGGNAVVEK
jgi:hypothetical protein